MRMYRVFPQLTFRGPEIESAAKQQNTGRRYCVPPPHKTKVLVFARYDIFNDEVLHNSERFRAWRNEAFGCTYSLKLLVIGLLPSDSGPLWHIPETHRATRALCRSVFAAKTEGLINILYVSNMCPTPIGDQLHFIDQTDFPGFVPCMSKLPPLYTFVDVREDCRSDCVCTAL
jgi:hypothetical protein